MVLKWLREQLVEGRRRSGGRFPVRFSTSSVQGSVQVEKGSVQQ